MKLLRLKINQDGGFRSLHKGFEIYFLRDFDYIHANDFNPIVLAGRNGSGKSNILEALANIFYHLDCMFNDYLPDGFLYHEDENPNGFNNEVGVVDAYELEYFMPVPTRYIERETKGATEIPILDIRAHIRITKVKKCKPIFEWVNRSDYSTKTEPLGKKEIQRFLPKYVLGYSSGENELLSLPFFKTRFLHYDEYADKLRLEELYGKPPKPEGRLVYLDKDLSQAILLSNLLMQKEEDENDILIPLLENIELKDVDEFRLIICKDILLEYDEQILRDMDLSDDDIINNKHKVELTTNLNESIEALKSCATCFEIRREELENNEEGREYLILDYKVTSETKKAFRFHFADNPLQLFQLFQLLLELNAYVVSEEDKERVYHSKNIFINHDIYPNPLEDDRVLRFKNLWIKKDGLEKSLFTKELSDGEHQFLHSLGLCLLFRKENALFLLDEPETHFNPDWKAKFITNIRHCFSEEYGTMREMLITTHSPYLVSDSEAKYVRIFEKDDKNKEVTARFPDFQTLGTSVNKITIKVYNKPDTIGAYANQKISDLRAEFEKAADKKAFLKKVQNEIGESVERVLFINEILDKMDEK